MLYTPSKVKVKQFTLNSKNKLLSARFFLFYEKNCLNLKNAKLKKEKIKRSKMEQVPIALKRYAYAQGWSIRIYKNPSHCLRPCKSIIKLMIVNLQNILPVISATHGDVNTLKMWQRILVENSSDTVFLMNAPCRLQIALASTLTPKVLYRDVTLPFECDCCKLMCIVRAPIYCKSCDADRCEDCYATILKETIYGKRDFRNHPIDIHCERCNSELVGSWGDVYRMISAHGNK